MPKPLATELRRPLTIGVWLAVLLELAELARRLPRIVAIVMAAGIVFTGAMLVAIVAAHWHAFALFAIAYLLIRYGARMQRWHAGRNVPPARPTRPTARRKA